MKDGCLSKLTISESSNRAIQYKKIVDALPVYCGDKQYQYIDDIICKNTKLLESAFLPPYLVATQWSTTYHIKIETVDMTSPPATDGSILHCHQTNGKEDSRFLMQIFRNNY